jgi:hypothetical protein
VIYVLDPTPESAFVITAYEMAAKTLAAYRRRLLQEGTMKKRPNRFPLGWNGARVARVLAHYR